MAVLHVKSPNGTTQTVNLGTMNLVASINGEGYIKFQNNLIMQWVWINGTANHDYRTFPISFPNKFLSCVVCGYDNNTASQVTTVSFIYDRVDKNKIMLNMVAHYPNGSHLGGNIYGNMIAIGY